MLGAALFSRRGGPSPLLSEREQQVLQHLADGLTTEGVGKALYLSPATVRSYAENAMHKLEATNRVHAVASALRLGLIN
jgi:two-component system response regulator DesR